LREPRREPPRDFGRENELAHELAETYLVLNEEERHHFMEGVRATIRGEGVEAALEYWRCIPGWKGDAMTALVPTGRGSYVPASQVSLAELLRRYDLAHPEHTVIPRETVIAAYHEASSVMNAAQEGGGA
jgi:hypothetical protein